MRATHSEVLSTEGTRDCRREVEERRVLSEGREQRNVCLTGGEAFLDALQEHLRDRLVLRPDQTAVNERQ